MGLAGIRGQGRAAAMPRRIPQVMLERALRPGCRTKSCLDSATATASRHSTLAVPFSGHLATVTALSR
jgi:hypothetical protein